MRTFGQFIDDKLKDWSKRIELTEVDIGLREYTIDSLVRCQQYQGFPRITPIEYKLNAILNYIQEHWMPPLYRDYGKQKAHDLYKIEDQ